MHYNTMGCNGEKPSLLGFGCMRFPTVVQDGQERIDEAEAVRMMEKAIEGGVNYFDTAYPYHGGESELVVGRFMKDKKREDFYIATKLPMWEVKTREDVSRLFEEQLEKLQMDYVDYYMLHALDTRVPRGLGGRFGHAAAAECDNLFSFKRYARALCH